MRPLFTRNNILNTYVAVFIFILTYTLISSIYHGFFKESPQISELLINYQGGFVRRGLLGEIIFQAHKNLRINPYFFILCFSLITYLLLVFFFVKSFIQKGYSLFILPFVFFLGNPIIHDFWVRKDVLQVLLFITIIKASFKEGPWKYFTINSLLILALLIHEGIGFFCFPILILILFQELKRQYNSFFNALTRTFLSILPSLPVFLIVIYFNGSTQIAFDIWSSWSNIDFPFQSEFTPNPPASIDGLTWSLDKGLMASKSTLYNFNNDIYAPIAWLLIIIVIYFIVSNLDHLRYRIFRHTPKNTFDNASISAILIFQFVAVFPLFILGWDYSRWVFYWVCSSMAIVLIAPTNSFGQIIPSRLSQISTSFNRFLLSFLSKSFIIPLCVFIGFSPFSWNFNEAILSNSFFTVLQFFSIQLSKIFVFLHLI